MSKINILGTEIDKINYSQTLAKIEEFVNDEQQHYIVTPNPEILLQASKNTYYRGVLNNASLSLPDGFGLILGSWFLGDPLYHRITGIDLTYKIASLASQKGYRIFLLGGKNNAANIAKTKLELKYKNIKIVGAEEGFINIHHINPKKKKKIIQNIKNSEAQILLVAYGAPFQEKWIYKNLKNIPNIKLAIGVGGTFDFISGKIQRAPKWMRKIGLEWLWRLFMEPNRINRILNATLKYSWYLILWLIHLRQPLRKNVLAVILNSENKFLVVNRKYDPQHWQFPQGGIDGNETEEEAVLREVKEETGLSKLKIATKLNRLNRYYWPPEILKKRKERKKDKFCGQVQRIIILKQTEAETPNPQEEHLDYKWVTKRELKDTIHVIRQKSLKIILEHIDKYIK